MENSKETFMIRDYLVERKKIARGSFSSVYKGINIKKKYKVAIKRIHSCNVRKMKQYIDQEISIIKKLKHRNVIKLYEVIIENDEMYLIFEYCSRGDLTDFLKNKPLSEKFAKIYIKQLVCGLQYLVENDVIHRDLKPANILITEDYTLKITDFVFARILEGNNLAETICGSPMYMSPELLTKNNYSNKSDLWSLGVIIYEIITGLHPFRAKTLKELLAKTNKEIIFPENINISENCKELIYKLLEKDVNKRLTWYELFNHEWLNSKNLFFHEYEDNKIKSENTENRFKKCKSNPNLILNYNETELESSYVTENEPLMFEFDDNYVIDDKNIDNNYFSNSLDVNMSSDLTNNLKDDYNNYLNNVDNDYILINSPPDRSIVRNSYSGISINNLISSSVRVIKNIASSL